MTSRIAQSSFLRGAIYAAGLIGPIWLASSGAFACGQPLTVDDIQHGIMPSEANLPCRNNAAPAVAPQRRVIQRPVPPPRLTDQKGARVGRAMITVADEYFAKQEYAAAASTYSLAADMLRKAGDFETANVAARKYLPAHCEDMLKTWDGDPDGLMTLQKDKICPDYSDRIKQLLPEARARQKARQEERAQARAQTEADAASHADLLTDKDIGTSMATSFSRYGVAAPKLPEDNFANGQTLKDTPKNPPVQLVAKGMTVETQKPTNNASGASTKSFNIPTPCQDLKGKYGCQTAGAVAMNHPPSLPSGQTQIFNRPKQWVPGGVAPDVQAEVLQLASSLLDTSDTDPVRVTLKRRLERRLAEHHVALKTKDLACLQPVHSSGPRMVDIPLRWTYAQIKKEGIDRSGLCKDAGTGDALELCRDNKFGLAVMWAEPEIAALCRAGNPKQEMEVIGDCARRKFMNAASSGVVSAPLPADASISETCNPQAPAKQRIEALRERLRAALAAARSGGANQAEVARDEPQEPSLDPNVQSEVPAPSPSVPTDDNEAYCSYMARQDVRGELTPSKSTAIPSECSAAIAAAEKLKIEQRASGHGVFSMNADETDAQIRRLMKQEPEK